MATFPLNKTKYNNGHNSEKTHLCEGSFIGPYPHANCQFWVQRLILDIVRRT